jgi:hypothetical protein
MSRSFDDIEHRIVYTFFADAPGPETLAEVKAALRAAYEGSNLLADAFDAWLAANPNDSFEVEYYLGRFGGPPGRLIVDPEYVRDIRYVSIDGYVVAETLLSGIVHELGHALTTNLDNDSFFNLAGDNITNIAAWYGELGIKPQASYHAVEANFPSSAYGSDIGLNILTVGSSYTRGEEVTNVVLDRGYYRHRADSNHQFEFDTTNVDLSSQAVSGGSLIIGSSADNIYGGTSSRDFIYGNGGEDEIKGYDGDDELSGGEGADTVEGGDGDDWLVSDADGEIDTFDGGDGTDTIIYRYNGASTITLGSTIGSEGFSLSISLSGASSFGVDNLVSVEMASVEAGEAVDILNVSAEGIDILADSIGFIDLGGGAAEDVIDISGWSTTDAQIVLGAEGRLGWADGSIRVLGAERGIGGGGNDTITVEFTAGTGPAIGYTLIGGGGSDVLSGGDGNDVIIDQQAAPSSDIYIQPGGWGPPMRAVIGSIEAGAGDDEIVIDVGGMPGITFGGDENGYGSGPEIPSGGNSFNYFVSPGQGNDQTTINFNGSLEYKYDRGDGVDRVELQSAGSFGLSTNPWEFPLSTLEMAALTVDASGYSRSEASISFNETSRQLVMIDPPGGDNNDLYAIKGSVVIAFSDGGSITIDNVYGVVAEDWRFADENEFNVYNARFPFQIRFSDEEVNQIGIAGSAYGRSGASSSIAPLNEPTDFVYGGSERLSSPTALGGMRERTLHDTFEVPLMGAAGWPASIHDALKAPMEDAAFAAVARYDDDQSARRLHLDPSQHELAGGPASAVLDLQSYLTSSEPAAFGSPAPVGQESVAAQSLESYLGSSSDTDVVRKLAIIRQDMSTFGVVSGPESERLRPDMPESLYFYA